MAAKKPVAARKVWRVTPEAPMGEIVDFDPTEPEARPAKADAPAKVLDPALVTDWRGSSFDLLNGTEVWDHTDTIPGDLFDKLFKR